MRAERNQWWHRILVPTDFTPACVPGLRRAASLPERFGGTIYLPHLIESPPFAMNGPAMMLMEAEEEMSRDATRQLLPLGGEELGPHLRSRPLVRWGRNAAREILNAAETLDCDSIVRAAHKRTALGRLPFGSTADQLLHHACGPVLLFPCADHSQLEPTLWKDSEASAEAKPLVPAA